MLEMTPNLLGWKRTEHMELNYGQLYLHYSYLKQKCKFQANYVFSSRFGQDNSTTRVWL